MKNFEIEIKKLDYLFENLPSGLIAIFALSLIIYFTLDGLVESLNLTLWVLSNILLLTLRALLLSSYKKTVISSSNFLKYYWSFFILTVLTAFLWGISAFIILPDTVEFQMIIILLIAGLISGSVVSLASRIEIFRVYIVLALLPYSYIFYLVGTKASLVFSSSILLYTAILLILSKKISQSVVHNIIFAQTNKDLVAQLEEKVREANVANRSKSEFLSVMSHEIRTPLNAIMGFVQVLKKDEKDKKKYKYLDTIDKSSKTLRNIINDILDMSKIESGKFNLESIEFQPKDEFKSLSLLFEQNALEKGVNLISTIPKDLPETLKSDVLRIKQILSNLLSNAIKFTPVGKNVLFTVSYKPQNSTLSFKVKDEGIGIDEKNIQLITEAFTQADSSTAREYGGTGLGLNIVTNLLQLFGSTLKIESQLHQGSSFSFEIKVEAAQKKVETEQENHQHIYRGKKVLVAEDNKTNQMLINILLQESDIEVTMANDGEEVQELFKKDIYDLILMDINMPKKNGIEAMKEIKEYENRQSLVKTPIVALTANAVSGDKENYLKDGFDAYLAKPIEINELQKVFQKYFT